MDNQNIASWLQQARAAGVSDEQIKQQLKSAGWDDSQIIQVLGGQSSTIVPSVVSTGTLISVGEQFSQAWEFFKNRWKTLVGVNSVFTLAPLVIYLILFLIVFLVAGGIATSVATSPYSPTNDTGLTNSISSSLPFTAPWIAGGTFFIFFALFLVIPILMAIIQVMNQAALIAVVVSNEAINFSMAMRQGWQKIWSLLWISFLVGIICMGPVIVLQLINVGIATVAGDSSDIVSVVIPVLILIAFVWVITSTIFLIFAPYVLFAEGLKGMDALKRSFHLVKNHWWEVFLRNVLIGFALTAAMVVSIITIVGPLVIILAATPFMMIYTYLFFQSLRGLNAPTT